MLFKLNKTTLLAFIITVIVTCIALTVRYCQGNATTTKGYYELTYVVYYTDSIHKTSTIVNDYPIKVYSFNGTNYVIAYNDNINYTEILSTTAPIGVTYYKAEVSGEN